ERVLLVRRNTGREFLNLNEVLDTCHRYGFRPVDTSRMSLSEQIDLFGRAGYVIGAHGAGLMNLLFQRGAPLSLLELFPDSPSSIGWIMAHYFYLCRALGFGYYAMNVSAPTGD